MKHNILLITVLCFFVSTVCLAQNVATDAALPLAVHHDSIDDCDDGRYLADTLSPLQCGVEPLVPSKPRASMLCWPASAPTLPAWPLHEGFNAQLSMSMTAGFGHHAPRGVGFGQSAAFAYAQPLSKRFSAIVGICADHMDWGRYRSTDVGVSAAVAYRLTDDINVYAYATKSFTPSPLRRAMFPASPLMLRDCIGAMAEFKVGANTLIQVSVERREY